MAALLLAAFFAFVGWSKATAPLDELARYHAWTVYLPEWLGRLVGWSELALALGLLTVPFAKVRCAAGGGAVLLIANQACAAAVHALHGEAAALPQNAVLMLLLAFVAWATLTNEESVR